MIREIRREIEKKELLLTQIEKFIQNASEGSLTCQRKNGKVYYYQKKRNESTGGFEKKYIKKGNLWLAKQLAQKGYLLSVSLELKRQICILKRVSEEYYEESIEEIYNRLPEERKTLVEPLCIGVQEIIDTWNNETYEPYLAFSEGLIFETDQGEMVRSKSEVIIANVLYQYHELLAYKYERPLELISKDGRSITIHPDFTILNKWLAFENMGW